MIKPPLPLPELVEQAAGDSNDYCDGDCAGYHSGSYEPESGVLSLHYSADRDFSPNGSAMADFVEVGHLLDVMSGEGLDWSRGALLAALRRRLNHPALREYGPVDQ